MISEFYGTAGNEQPILEAVLEKFPALFHHNRTADLQNAFILWKGVFHTFQRNSIQIKTNCLFLHEAQ